MIAAPLALLNQVLTPVINLMAGRPVLATFQAISDAIPLAGIVICRSTPCGTR